jgi:lysophospholipase L1-like esterase
MADKLIHVRDDLLGWAPRAGHSEADVTIDADGLRVTGPAPAPAGTAPVLAVGDSFTYGEGVFDAEAWPAQLQGLVDRRVLNGGVSGYGFDQIVLRAEQLALALRPSVIVVSFIADDLQRTEMSRMWGYDKPWFAIEEGQLRLKGVPSRRRGRSLLPPRLVERFFMALTPSLQALLGYHVRVHRRGTGPAIAGRLVERLAALQAKGRTRIMVLAQYDPNVWIDRAFANEQRGLAQSVLDRAKDNGLATLDSFARLAAEPEPRALYRSYHMNPRGNLVIARLVATALARLDPGCGVVGAAGRGEAAGA